MFIINRENNRITKLNQKTFSELGFRERDHLQEPQLIREDGYMWKFFIPQSGAILK